MEATVAATPEDVTLRDHVDAALIIEQFIAEHEGELTPEIEALMRDHENATKEKVESIAWFVKTEKARITGIESMIVNLAARKKAIENRIDWLTKSYLMDQLHRLGLKPGEGIKGTLSTIRLQLNNPKLVGEIAEDRLVDMKLDPVLAPFVRYTPEAYALDKAATLTALKGAKALLDEHDRLECIALSSEGATDAERAAARTALEAIDDTAFEAAVLLVGDLSALSIVRDESVRIQ